MAARKVTVLVVLAAVQLGIVAGQDARAFCRPAVGTTNTNQIFQYEFRFLRQTRTDISSIGYYNSSEPITDTTTINFAAGCSDTSVDGNGGFQVINTVDGAGALPCGIEKTGNTYTISIGASGTSGNIAYRFMCVTQGGGNLNNNPTQLDETSFQTKNIQHTLSFISNRHELFFDVFFATGPGVPAKDVILGEKLKLRATLDKDAKRPIDTIGYSFHAVFLKHDGANLYLELITPGTGSLVQITGSQAGESLNLQVSVLRDHKTLVTIPDNYKYAASSGNTWVTSDRVVEVKVLSGMPIGVKAISEGSNDRGEYLVMPDDALGKQYNCYTGTTVGTMNGLVLVYTTEDNTALTVDFNSFTTRGSITIAGTSGPSVIQVINGVNKNKVLTIECGNECDQLQISSDKPVGVVTGHENSKVVNTDTNSGHIVSQLPPVRTYDKRFVFKAGERYQYILEDPNQTVDYTKGSASPATGQNSGLILEVSTGTEEIVFSKPVLVLQLARQPTGFDKPYSAPLPSTIQWSRTQYVFYPETAVTFEITFVAYVGELAAIRYRTSYTGYATVGGSPTPVTNNGTSVFETLTVTIPRPSQEYVLMEFRAGERNRPFIIYVQRQLSGNSTTLTQPWGVLMPTVNQCVPSPLSSYRPFASNYSQYAGDGVDNDCDGLIDEEQNNGEDDTTDTDNEIDDDVASHPVPTDRIGIFVDSLKISNNAGFTSGPNNYVADYITNGCPVLAVGARSRIEGFTWNKNVGTVYDHLHVVETAAFGAFYIGSPTVYFRIQVGFCNASLAGSRCETSCVSSGRKRREADEFFTMDAQINIEGEPEEESMQGDDEVCSMSSLYWIPAVLVLLTILVECVVTGALLVHRSALLKDRNYHS